MRKDLVPKTIGSIILAVFLSSFSQAEEAFQGGFIFGFRAVGTSGPGAGSKYREDINLRGGARLNEFSLSYAPADGWKRFLDRLDIAVHQFGGDPFETFSASIQKSGRYLLKFDRRKSDYVFQDLFPGDGGAFYDRHTFDFERVADSGLARIWLTRSLDMTLSFDRYRRAGQSTTSLDVERAEFEFEKPVRDESKNIALGLNFRLDRISFSLEEQILNYENTNSLFLPGYAGGGENAASPTSLDAFELREPFEMTSRIHTLRFSARPIDRLLLNGTGQLSDVTLDLDYAESARGLDSLGRILRYDRSGQGTFSRDLQLYEFDASLLLWRNLSLAGGVRFEKHDQEGTLAVGGRPESIEFSYQTVGSDFGLQYEFSPRFSLTLGYRFENRRLDGIETVTYDFDTIHHGAFGSASWNPRRNLKLTLEYERRTFSNPFSLISPTDTDRLRLTLRYDLRNFRLTAAYIGNDSKSEIEADLFQASRRRLNLRAEFHRQGLNASVGYSRLESSREGKRTVVYPPFWTGPGGSFVWGILHEGKADIWDMQLSYDLGPRWKIGGYGNLYSNSGSYEVKRTTVMGYLEHTFLNSYVGRIGYRFVDFGEPAGRFNDYTARIFEVSFGYRWK